MIKATNIHYTLYAINYTGSVVSSGTVIQRRKYHCAIFHITTVTGTSHTDNISP